MESGSRSQAAALYLHTLASRKATSIQQQDISTTIGKNNKTHEEKLALWREVEAGKDGQRNIPFTSHAQTPTSHQNLSMKVVKIEDLPKSYQSLHEDEEASMTDNTKFTPTIEASSSASLSLSNAGPPTEFYPPIASVGINSSEGAKKAIVDGVMELVERPIGSVETMVV